ncbi:TRAP-type C4-dicarboxylate transport system, small permease component [Rubellimicrobium thermophilum DSM 16684]|uniref:TRAP transporter small permease protein n=1 Tax=Rubellimicrobium thermophilum DSM 16684 TaxID=1123069 RepID=S9R627_9RHOB|nr:TRAP transporter small permease [Rubellimicrobium thermophilum]EPX87453.1 TRAP-type C4-dicarboxylate transport system, small permease component [Rubellimicrobium thermophilum DSM 16684]
MPGGADLARSGLLDRASLALAAMAGACLLFMVLLIAVGVVLRYGFARPILGLNEIVQLTSVAVVMLALPWATADGAHVRVDVLDHRLGVIGRHMGDLLSRGLSALVLGVLVWRAVLKAIDARRYADATNMLGLPLWPFYAILAMGMALCVVILLAQGFAILRRGPRDA